MKKRIIVIIFLAIIFAVLLWFFVLTRTFLNISSSTGAFEIYQNGTRVLSDQKNGIVYLKKGNYTIVETKDGNSISAQYLSTTILPWQSVSIIPPSVTKETYKARLLLGRQAVMITPLGDGYLYKNPETRGIEYADASGIKDVSSSFDIVSKELTEPDSSYNTLVNIEKGSDATYVTTSRAIYRLTSLNDIQGSSLDGIIITRSSLDNKAKKINFIVFNGKGTYSAYSLPTNNLTSPIQQVISGNVLINKIDSNGNTAVVYNDNIPNTTSATTNIYKATRQVSPVIIDLKTSKTVELKTPQDTPIADLTLDENGKYIAYRAKMSDYISILDKEDHKEIAKLPATTLTKLKWDSDTLYYNYGPLLLAYSPKDSNSTSSVSMSAPYSITDFAYRGSTPVVTTNENFSFIGSKSTMNVDTSKILFSSADEGYSLSFSAIDDSLHIFLQCNQDYTCNPGGKYSQTLTQLSKLTGKNATVQNVPGDFFFGNYSFLKTD
ncbi:MAG: hypothetical protein WBP12_04210 [Candidatus Saccharimonas sp.]